MTRKLVAVVIALASAGAALGNPSGGSSSNGSIELLARRAASSDKATSAKAITELRAMGPKGLSAFIEANQEALELAFVEANQVTLDAARRESDRRLLAALDSIAGQKDSYASRLYWYTDIEAATTAARAAGKPILSLRLLGRLDEDLSCANSRFFRVALYANEEISSFLREHYVLHWQSVRPVPKVVINFGDGRVLERTVTGNSIHYVLDSQGRLIDALPGVYGPGAFLRELLRAEVAVSTINKARTEAEREQELRQYHQTRLGDVENRWLSDVKRAGLSIAPFRQIRQRYGSTPPSAATAAPLAITKAGVERPMVRGLSPQRESVDFFQSDAAWSAIARLYSADARLDSASRTLMSRKDSSLTGRALLQAVAAFQVAIAEDTVRNEYIFRDEIHRWIAAGGPNLNVERLNERVYADLFLTPSWDEWLGLRPTGTYSGIDGDGVLK